jgi:hypothetical protein
VVGGYVFIKIGARKGLKVGYMAVILNAKQKAIARGYITAVLPDESTIELDSVFGLEPIKRGMSVLILDYMKRKL